TAVGLTGAFLAVTAKRLEGKLTGTPIRTVHETATAIIITLSSGKDGAPLMACWLVGWTFFGGFIGLGFLTGLVTESVRVHEYIFCVVWLVGWAFGELVTARMLLWKLAGRERIVLDAKGLHITNYGYGQKRTCHYRLGDIYNLSVVEGYDGRDKYAV